MHCRKPLMCCVHQYQANRNVFKCCLNVSLVAARSRGLPGKEFHTDRPDTEKARRPNVLSPPVARNTTRESSAAESKTFRDATPEAGWQKWIKYYGA